MTGQPPTLGQIIDGINRLRRRMHLVAEHSVFSPVDEDDTLWKSGSHEPVCPICNQSL